MDDPFWHVSSRACYSSMRDGGSRRSRAPPCQDAHAPFAATNTATRGNTRYEGETCGNSMAALRHSSYSCMTSPHRLRCSVPSSYTGRTGDYLFGEVHHRSSMAGRSLDVAHVTPYPARMDATGLCRGYRTLRGVGEEMGEASPGRTRR